MLIINKYLHKRAEDTHYSWHELGLVSKWDTLLIIMLPVSSYSHIVLIDRSNHNNYWPKWVTVECNECTPTLETKCRLKVVAPSGAVTLSQNWSLMDTQIWSIVLFFGAVFGNQGCCEDFQSCFDGGETNQTDALPNGPMFLWCFYYVLQCFYGYCITCAHSKHAAR